MTGQGTGRIAFQGEPGAYGHQACADARPGMEALPCATFEEVFADPRIQRDLIVELDHPRAGKFKLLANPLKLSGTPLRKVSRPPVLGEHTAEVLAEYGISLAAGDAPDALEATGT